MPLAPEHPTSCLPPGQDRVQAQLVVVCGVIKTRNGAWPHLLLCTIEWGPGGTCQEPRLSLGGGEGKEGRRDKPVPSPPSPTKGWPQRTNQWWAGDPQLDCITSGYSPRGG